MNIFTVKDNIPQISPEALFIPEMREMWNADKSDSKGHATKVLAYIYHMADPKSVYYNLEEREAQILMDFFPNEDWHPDEKVEAAIEKYKLMNTTESVDMLESAIELTRKLSSFFREVDFAERDEKGKPVYQPKSVMESLQKVPGTIKALQDLKERVKKEQSSLNTNVRGNERFNIFEESDD